MYSQGTKGLDPRKPRLLARLQDLIAWVDRDICMEPDEFAHHRCWTVTRTGFGSRRYRDPRFDQLRVPPRVAEEVS